MYKRIMLDIDMVKLKEETMQLFKDKKNITSYFPNQIGLTYASEDCVNKFHDACGSLDFDYTRWTDEDRDNDIGPPERIDKLSEQDFNKIVPELEGTYTYTVLKELQQKFNIGRTRLMLLNSKQCLSWHKDSTYRFHIPIKTQQGCIMVWENCTLHMPEGECYWVDTTEFHTAFNGSISDRIHLVATLKDIPNE